MRVKSHSMMLGYREFEARIKPSKPVQLELEGHGDLSHLEYIKHGFKIVHASDQEMAILKEAGFK